MARKTQAQAIIAAADAAPTHVPSVTNALLGAIETLTRMGRGDFISSIEFYSRLHAYRLALLATNPDLASDPYYGQFFK